MIFHYEFSTCRHRYLHIFFLPRIKKKKKSQDWKTSLPLSLLNPLPPLITTSSVCPFCSNRCSSLGFVTLLRWTLQFYICLFYLLLCVNMDFPGGTSGKEPACQCKRYKRHGSHPLGREDPLEEGMETHSRTLAWRILWTEGPGRLQFIGVQRVGLDWSDLAHMPCEQKNHLEISNSKQNKGTILFSLVIRDVKIETLRYCFSPRKTVEIFVTDNINHVNKDVIKLGLLYTTGRSINGYHFSGTHRDIQNAHSLIQCAYFFQFSHKK